jgi:hypothetical protein
VIIVIFGDGGGALLMICGGAARVALALVASASRCASRILCFAGALWLLFPRLSICLFKAVYSARKELSPVPKRHPPPHRYYFQRRLSIVTGETEVKFNTKAAIAICH